MPGLMQRAGSSLRRVLKSACLPDADDALERLERHDIDLAILPSPVAAEPVPVASAF